MDAWSTRTIVWSNSVDLKIGFRAAWLSDCPNAHSHNRLKLAFAIDIVYRRNSIYYERSRQNIKPPLPAPTMASRKNFIHRTRRNIIHLNAPIWFHVTRFVGSERVDGWSKTSHAVSTNGHQRHLEGSHSAVAREHGVASTADKHGQRLSRWLHHRASRSGRFWGKEI